MLQIYNTLSKKKAKFKPLVDGKVSMYVCGMTVYDYCHIGHARMLIGFDMVARYLRYRGYQVTYVRNITDIDDKIINRANERGQTIQQLTDHFIQMTHEDERSLYVLAPDIEPLATDNMQGMIDMIQILMDKGFAYVGDNGDVFYEVRQFSDYGALSKQDLNELNVGERISVDTAKRHPLDFVLWKLTKRGEPSWDSPWGKGRPGWHIECSAMSHRCLGGHFDIHGGGMDLKFPHHENEIAQSQAATGDKFVNVWMHVGFVQVNQEKMSKSLGNFFTIRDVLKAYHPEVVRYFILASHYRSPVNYSDDNLNSAKGALVRLYTAIRGVTPIEVDDAGEYETRFIAAMDDDFNTPEAMAVLFDLARELNIAKEQGNCALCPGTSTNAHDEHAQQLAGMLKHLAGVLGLLQTDADEFLRAGVVDEQAIERLIAERNQARIEKNYAKADELREQLNQIGVELEDKAGETLWRIKQ